MEKFVDEKLHELTKHGEDEFPIALYGDSYYLYGNRFYYSHYHEEIEILFVVQGEISVDVNENTYRIKKGDILFINSNNLKNNCNFIPATTEAEKRDLWNKFMNKK